MTTAKKAPAKKKPAPPQSPIGDPFCVALFECQKSLPSVKKDAWNERHEYPYTSAEEMIRTCRQHLNAHGFLFTVLGWRKTDYTMVDHEGIVREVLVLQASLYHVPTAMGWTYDAPWPILPGRGRDAGKAVAASITTATAYLLKGLLAVDRVEPGAGLDDSHVDPEVPGSNEARQDFSDDGWSAYRDRLSKYGTTLEEVAADHPEQELCDFTRDQWAWVFTELDAARQK